MQRSDLALYDNSAKAGLKLWNYPAFALVLEIVVLFRGMYPYMKTTRTVARGGRFGVVIFGFVMLAVQVWVSFAPPPSSDNAAAVTAFSFGGIAFWVERKRALRSI